MRDTGTGLPAHIIGTLFTPFVTTKSHGLGIGLTIAQTIVDAHGGTIDARNNPDGGRDIHCHAAPQRNAPARTMMALGCGIWSMRLRTRWR